MMQAAYNHQENFNGKNKYHKIEKKNLIGHFRITFSLFLKVSLGAHPFI